MECISNPKYLITTSCDVRALARNIYKINATTILLHDYDDIWIRIILFYRTNLIYRKFLIDKWESACAYLAKNTSIKTEFLNAFYPNLEPFASIHHSCPILKHEIWSLTTDRYNLDTFQFLPLIPAGQYRLDVWMAFGDNKTVAMKYILNFSVSDHRVWY